MAIGDVLLPDLNPAIRRMIKEKEKLLGRKFYRAWPFTNPKGETFLFARFGRLRDDHTIVTLAHENKYCLGGWEPTH